MQKRLRITIKLTPKQEEQLKEIANTYGIGTIAGLAQYALIEKLPLTPPTLQEEDMASDGKVRVELKLGASIAKALEHMAEQESMSLNRFIVLLLHNYIMKEKIMSNLQLQTLRNSNFQLFQIGKNINQIAKALNSKQPAHIGLPKLQEIANFIEQHTDKVMQVISYAKSI